MGLGGFFKAIGRGIGAFERAAQNAQLQYRGWTPEVIDAAQKQLAYTLQKDEEERRNREEERRANRELRDMSIKDRRDAQRRNAMADLAAMLKGAAALDPTTNSYSIPDMPMPTQFADFLTPEDIGFLRTTVTGDLNRTAAEKAADAARRRAEFEYELGARGAQERGLLGARAGIDVADDQRRMLQQLNLELLKAGRAPLSALPAGPLPGGPLDPPRRVSDPAREAAMRVWLDTNGPVGPGAEAKTPQQMAAEIAELAEMLAPPAPPSAPKPLVVPPGGLGGSGAVGLAGLSGIVGKPAMPRPAMPAPAPSVAPPVAVGASVLTPGERAALAGLPPEDQAEFQAVLATGDPARIAAARRILAGG